MLRINKRALIIFAEEWTLKKITRATILFMEKVRLFGKFSIDYMLSSWVSLKYPPPKKNPKQTNKGKKTQTNKQKLPKYPPPQKRIKPNKLTKEKKPNKQTKSPKNQKPKTWHAFVHVKIIYLYLYKIQCARTHVHTHTRARAHVCLCVCYLHNAEKRVGCHLILLLRDHVISVWKQIAYTGLVNNRCSNVIFELWSYF